MTSNFKPWYIAVMILTIFVVIGLQYTVFVTQSYDSVIEQQALELSLVDSEIRKVGVIMFSGAVYQINNRKEFCGLLVQYKDELKMLTNSKNYSYSFFVPNEGTWYYYFGLLDHSYN